jgi:hypothetical protein
MTITKTFTIDTTEEIDTLIDRLKLDCEGTAEDLIQELPLDNKEYFKYKNELSKELFEDVVAKLIFDSKAE